MRLLVLGGTRFLGRHLVEAALARGDEVTLFNRGHTNPALFPDVERLQGDRDADLSPLEGRRWDAVIDPSGYVPRVVRASVELLAAAVEHYAFVSSISAYRDFLRAGIAEDYPVAALAEESEDVSRHYGALKALCEDVVRDVFADRALVVRAGLIVGRYDWTNRFGWWVRRIAAGGRVLVPEPLDAPVQIVDARDLAEWMLAMAANREGGTFNATGPRRSLVQVLDEIRAVTQSDAELVPVGEDFLVREGVETWTELPLWLAPSANPAFAHMLEVDTSAIAETGFTTRPLAETIRAVLAWETRPDAELDGGASHALDPERERELLAAWATMNP